MIVEGERADETLSATEQKALAKRGVRLAEHWEPQVTLLVASSIKRSLKFLAAVCAGVPIVSRSYLDAVVQLPALGVLPSPEAYALDDAKGEKQHSFRLSQALAAARRTPLLGGREVFVFPSAGKADGKGMTAAQVKLLVVAAGGGLLDRLPRARPLPDKILVLADETQKVKDVQTYPAQVLIDAVFPQSLYRL